METSEFLKNSEVLNADVVCQIIFMTFILGASHYLLISTCENHYIQFFDYKCYEALEATYASQ